MKTLSKIELDKLCLDELELVCKGLETRVKRLRKASTIQLTLEDKIIFQRKAQAAERLQHVLRKSRFQLEDAIRE